MTTDIVGTIKTASFSTLKLFERCPLAAAFKCVMRAPAPEPSEALNRGSHFHKLLEQFIRGELTTLPRQLEPWLPQLEALRALYIEAPDVAVMLETEWALTQDLNPCDWNDPDVWIRAKPDVVIPIDDDELVIIDFKTGKRAGNEVKHHQQVKFYAAIAFYLFPQIEDIGMELWYLDEKGLIVAKYIDRERGALAFIEFIEKIQTMTTTTDFPPKPNVHNCKWCDYGVVKGTGICPYAVEPL